MGVLKDSHFLLFLFYTSIQIDYMKYLKITSPDINNGTGCRVTLWLPGCTHKCPGCHNAWTADYNIGKDFDDKAKCEIYNILNKSYISGITISGGDPLDQNETILEELKLFLCELKEKYPTKSIWIYTGYKYNDLNANQLAVLAYCKKHVSYPEIKAFIQRHELLVLLNMYAMITMNGGDNGECYKRLCELDVNPIRDSLNYYTRFKVFLIKHARFIYDLILRKRYRNSNGK